MTFHETIQDVGKVIDGVGVAAIVIGILVATWTAGRRRVPPGEDWYRVYRQQLGKAILLGLELLVAADIIRTVAVEPTIRTAAVLAIIVVIRTVLSFSLETELDGRVPWRRNSTRGGFRPNRPRLQTEDEPPDRSGAGANTPAC